MGTDSINTGHIPISFECEGKKYVGYFSPVMGAGSTAVFYLEIDNFYCGRLRYTNQWVFDPTPKTQQFVALTDFFGRVVMAAGG